MFLLYIFICLVFGYCCSLIAKSKGHNQKWAWFWGIVGGMLAVIVYLFLGETKEKKIEEMKKIMADVKKEMKDQNDKEN